MSSDTLEEVRSNPSGLCRCGCGEPAPIATMTSKAKGHIKGQPVRFCVGHYSRTVEPRPLEERFWEKVDKRGPDDCWEWTGATDDGYGKIRGEKRIVVGAHRVSYEIANGPIPEGREIDHLCRNPSCVNPSHLDAVTRQINQLRGVSVSAENARKTHCPKGHPYAGENLIEVFGKSQRYQRRCRACKRERDRNYRKKVEV